MSDAAYLESIESQAGLLPPADQERKRDSSWAWVVGAIVVLLAAGVAYLYFSRRRPPPPVPGGATLNAQPLQFTPCVQGQCDQFAVAGTDAGSTACMSMTYYAAQPPAGYGALGSYVQCVSSSDGCGSPSCPQGEGFSTGPNSLVVSTSPDQGQAAPVNPSSFGPSGGYCNTCATQNFSVWSMECPKGYVSVGDVVAQGCGAPNASDYWCIPIECALPGVAGSVLWEDAAPSGGCHNPQSVTLFGVAPADPDKSVAGLFFKAAYGGRAPPPAADLWVPRASCTVVAPSRPASSVADGSYYILWGTSYLQAGSDGSLSLAYNPQSPTTWAVSGGRLSPSPGLYVTTGSVTSTPASVSVTSGGAYPGEWVLSAEGLRGAGALYNSRCNGCLSSELLLVVRDCGPQTSGWTFIPA